MSKIASKKRSRHSSTPSVLKTRGELLPRIELQPATRGHMLVPIPAEPTPTKKEIAAELRKQNSSLRAAPLEWRRKFAELFWHAAAREKHPDLFWWPFAPEGYSTYLNSVAWKQISKEVKQAAGNKCACCPNEARAVHHRCYRPRVLSGEDRSLLIALCHACHKTVDFDEKGKVRNSLEKERVLAEMFARESERLAFSASATT